MAEGRATFPDPKKMMGSLEAILKNCLKILISINIKIEYININYIHIAYGNNVYYLRPIPNSFKSEELQESTSDL